MALRYLATRMRSPAEAALRLRAAPRGSRPLYTYPIENSKLFSKEEVKEMYKKSLEQYNRLKEHDKLMTRRAKIALVTGKGLSWTFKLLIPYTVAKTFVKVT